MNMLKTNVVEVKATNPFEKIEITGRTCYQSKRPEGKTAKDFYNAMVQSGHHAMLEHASFVFELVREDDCSQMFVDMMEKAKFLNTTTVRLQ